jgi:hypothetical protein
MRVIGNAAYAHSCPALATIRQFLPGSQPFKQAADAPVSR